MNARQVQPWFRGALGTLLFALLAAGASAAVAVSSAEVDALFAPWNKRDGPGAAVAVIQDGKIVYEHGYGMANLATQTAITPQTSFYVGSVSKQFAAASIALLARAGKLSLDDDVRKFVPELPDYGHRITLRHLVHHTSGLRDYLALRDIAGEPVNGTFGDDYVLRLLSRQKALNFPPGTQHLYSNSGYFLLSVVVKRVTGKTLRAFADEQIFRPLAMGAAGFRDDHTMPIAHRAEGYAGTAGSYRVSNPNFDVVGAGGVYMTVRDFLAWDRNFYQPVVGDPDFIKLLQTPGRLVDGTTLDYAFGLRVTAYRGQPIVEHSGAYGGFRAHVIRFPAQKFSVVCFANLGSMVPGTLARRVADLYLRDVLTAPESEPIVARTAPAGGGSPAKSATRTAAAAAMSDAQMAEFVGAYSSAELGVTYRITVSGGTLTLRGGHHTATPLRLARPDVLSAGGWTLSFAGHGAGKFTSFALQSGRAAGIEFVRD